MAEREKPAAEHGTLVKPAETTLAVALPGLIRSFVLPVVWRTIGKGLATLCPKTECALHLFLCPNDDPSNASAWKQAVHGLCKTAEFFFNDGSFIDAMDNGFAHSNIISWRLT